MVTIVTIRRTASKCGTECVRSDPMLVAVTAFMVAASGCGSSQNYSPSKSEELVGQSYQAIADNDIPRAIELLEQSIAIEPTAYAHYQVAQLSIRQTPDDDAKSIEHCKAGLAIAVEGATKDDLEWLLAECGKPKTQRFQGANQNPPSSSK